MAENTHSILRVLVAKVKCKPGWRFAIVDEDGAPRLRITDTKCVDAYDSDHESMPLAHFFPVPMATYNEKTWRRWIFECCRGVENHELGEWFVVDGERPFAPLHGPGEDPYVVHEFRDEADARVTQDGSMRQRS